MHVGGMAVQHNLSALTLIVVALIETSSSVSSCAPSGVNVRLVNGSSERSGRVELCWCNQWKAVCDDGWGIEEAITVCRELGCLNSNAIAVTSSHFGDAQEIHQLKQWNCQSTETTIAHCSKAIAHQNNYCTGSDTAGVYCEAFITITRLDSSSVSIVSLSPTLSTYSSISPTTSVHLPVPSVPRIGVITGTMCGIVVVIIAAGALVSVVSVYMYVRRRKKLHSHELELSRQVIKQVDRDKAAPKEEVSTKLGDSVVEHNFKNPLYTQVCLRDQTNDDSLSHSVSL